MKILIIHNKYQSKNIGGEDIVFKNEYESLKHFIGHQNVLSYSVSNDDINKFKLIFKIWYSFKHYKIIKSIIKKNNIDLVHIHNYFPKLTPSIFKAVKSTGVKLVHTMHNYRFWCISGVFYRKGKGICEDCTKSKFGFQGIKSGCYRGSIIQSFLAQIAFWFYRETKYIDDIDKIFVLTNFQKEKLIKFGVSRDKLQLKPNSIRPNLIPLDSNLKKGYAYVGRIEENKGAFLLLDLWLKLPNRYVLTMVGSGENINLIKKKYKAKNIVFKGTVSHLETQEIINKSKYLVHPSLCYETFGLSIVESMLLGTPVIGLKIGTRLDFIKNNVNGFICSIEELRQTIIESLNYSRYLDLYKNSKTFGNKFNNENILREQIKIYDNIIKSV